MVSPIQEQVQHDVEEPPAASFDDQIPIDSEDIEVINDAKQTWDARDILNNRDKFEAHIKEFDLDLQFQSVEVSDIFKLRSLPYTCHTLYFGLSQ